MLHNKNKLIIKQVIDEFLLEQNYNYHIGNIMDINNISPYYSDNKNVMQGRDTGHFGSGMYFSTYNGKYNNSSNKQNLIQIDKNVYRVDFDIYQNLYRVTSERHGDMLYNTLRNLNSFYYKIINNNYDCRRNYLIIKRNSEALNLNCPSYKKLIQMAIQLANNRTDFRSFSTKFMEYNGYNGVNVSKIPKYDNTLHGSVIYDLSKIDTNALHQVKANYNKIPYLDASVASDNEIDDIEYDVLRGKQNFYLSSLKNLPLDKAFYIIKSSNYIANDLQYITHYFDDSFVKRYLRLIFNKCKKKMIDNEDILYESANIKLLYQHKAFYFINLQPIKSNTIYGSMLLCLINEALYDNNSNYAVKDIMNNLQRDLTPFETSILSKWFNENKEITD